jgi:membrane protein required for colicin V production
MLDLPALPSALPAPIPTELPAGLPLDPAGWHWLDVTLVICVLFVALNAARRGFVREAGTLIGLGGGLVLAGRYSLVLVDLIAAEVGPLPLLDDAVWLGIVLLCGSVAALLASSLRASLPLPGIGIADRCFGLAFGVLEGAAGLGLVLLSAGRLGVLGLQAPGYDGSILAPVLLRWWLVVAASLPPELGFPRTL